MSELFLTKKYNIFNSYLKERKKYHLWMKTIDERTISNQEIQHLIQSHQLLPCKYHNLRPSIDRCEECGTNICINCSTILHFIGISFLCIKCFWERRKHTLKFLRRLFIVLFAQLLIVSVFITSILWGRIPYSLGMAILILFLFYGIGLTILISSYRKAKKKYIKWNSELDEIR